MLAGGIKLQHTTPVSYSTVQASYFPHHQIPVDTGMTIGTFAFVGTYNYTSLRGLLHLILFSPTASSYAWEIVQGLVLF